MRRTEARLRRSFERALLLALAPPALVALGAAACKSSASDPPPATSPDGSSSTTPEASSGDAGPSADPCAPVLVDGSGIDPDGGSCADYVRLPCGLPDAATVRNGCIVDLATCWDRCPSDLTFNCQLAPNVCDEGGLLPDAQTILECITCPGGAGRRPMGLAPARARPAKGALGAYFASLAHLEAASVRGFRDLARRLRTHGAPRRLLAAAARAADDERRHARAMASFARRHGGSPDRPRVSRRREPTLFELLEDNAIEGCVGETYGALLALAQAERAADPRVARAMKRVARDELSHAALAWEVLRWGLGRVSVEERGRIEGALSRALARLEERGRLELHADVQRAAGHPSASGERALVRALRGVVDAEWERLRT
jgi:hypothetical protein